MSDASARKPLDVVLHLPAFSDQISSQVPGLSVHGLPMDAAVPEGLRGDVLLTIPRETPNLRACLERGVRWVHLFATGVDGFPFEALDGQQLTCSRGASALPISEWVLANMLSFEKDLPERWLAEPPAQWNLADLGGLAGKTLGLVGFGAIGHAVARRALAFDMRVVAYRRTRTPSDLPGVTVVDALDEVLCQANHLVIAASATAETRHLIAAPELAMLQPGTHLINVARGSLIDQEALRTALDGGQLALASLDVCEPEPLPAGHWLYSHPKVHLSPHISWSAPGAIERLLDPYIDNLKRWQRGAPLLGQVDIEQGY